MRILFILTAVSFMSCATQFFVIESENKILGDEDERKTLHQVIVISHPPRDIHKLIVLVEEYNRFTLLPDDILDHSVDRVFYRETLSLTRNFITGEPYPFFSYGYWFFPSSEGQQIGNHVYTKDRLMDTYYSVDIEGRMFFQLFTRAKKIYHIELDNGNLLFKSVGDIYFSRAIDDPNSYFINK